MVKIRWDTTADVSLSYFGAPSNPGKQEKINVLSLTKVMQILFD